jgi:hypothetical protein
MGAGHYYDMTQHYSSKTASILSNTTALKFHLRLPQHFFDADILPPSEARFSIFFLLWDATPRLQLLKTVALCVRKDQLLNTFRIL